MSIPDLYQLYLQHPSVQTDTRKVGAGDIFFALKGPNFNGNAFALQALDAGAVYAVIDDPAHPALINQEDPRLIVVPDTLEALQALARHHREHFTIPFIAITGSNGKTTTKELVNAVLSSYYTTYTTQGNLNNHIGVPLTLLRIRKDAEMAVIEMGANHLHEIESYCRYTQPTHGIITNAGKAHLEGFGSVEGVKKGKGELFDYLRMHAGTAFVYADYDYLQSMSAGIGKIIQYGTGEGTVQGTVKASEPFLEVMVTQGFKATTIVPTQLVGDYNLPNVLCAIAIGNYFKVPEEKIIAAIADYAPSNSRSQLLEKDSNHIILDAYNANPSSMRAAIENFARLQSPHKIVMLGAMMELGKESVPEHEQLLELLQQYPWHQVVLVGGDFKGRTPAPFLYFPTSADAREWFRQQNFRNSHILIKGSRSMQMEKILE